MTFLFLNKAMNQFKAPQDSLGDIDPRLAATLIAAASDVALVVDSEGVIRDFSVSSDDLSQEGWSGWLGKPWIETVTVESRPKVQELLRDAAANTAPRWRQVNHPSRQGAADVPIRYSAVKVGKDGHVVAVGRDLRAVAVLQQRLVEAQQSMEREYARLRQAETRYRLLFRVASEAVVIIEAAGNKIIEANPASVKLLDKPAAKLVGRNFTDEFDLDGAAAVQTMLTEARSGGHAGGVQAGLAVGAQVTVSASIFRQDNASHFLVRLSPAGQNMGGAINGAAKVMKVVAALPDGFVVTDPERRILTTNEAFLDLAQLASEEQTRGELIDRWIGRPGVDVGVLVANLREHGSVRHFATVVRGEYGGVEDVEISGVSVLAAEQPCFGFTMRNVSRRLPVAPRSGRELPRSVEQMTELVGRVPLKDLVRETTDVIEKLCIEAALELTGDNRASAADMLGLSRQSLYAKLRRHGLGDLGPESEN
ncbi:MAG: transcriptional regulator PpsR [Hyphomicrobiales bacterium]|nr:transcriptional regulator PpsR [Hyphomicrobiales bacterium]